MKRYPIGDMISITAEFRDPVSNQPKNPSNVVLRILDPNGVESRPVINNATVGVFCSRFTPALAGVWHTRWEGTGVIQSAIEHEIEVIPSAFSGAQ